MNIVIFVYFGTDIEHGMDKQMRYATLLYRVKIRLHKGLQLVAGQNTSPSDYKVVQTKQASMTTML